MMQETMETIDLLESQEQSLDTPLAPVSREEVGEEDMEGTPIEEPEETAENDALPPNATEELALLRQEVEQLRASLAAKEQEQQRTREEIGEFHRLFPDIPIQGIPDGVWESVNQGIPLSAAYALYEKKQRVAQGLADEVNRRNASLSAGKAGKHTKGEYFSPDEVRAMSQRQVHNNYRAIMESMKHWH